jgi:hypothetical protein
MPSCPWSDYPAKFSLITALATANMHITMMGGMSRSKQKILDIELWIYDLVNHPDFNANA